MKWTCFKKWSVVDFLPYLVSTWHHQSQPLQAPTGYIQKSTAKNVALTQIGSSTLDSTLRPFSQPINLSLGHIPRHKETFPILWTYTRELLYLQWFTEYLKGEARDVHL